MMMMAAWASWSGIKKFIFHALWQAGWTYNYCWKTFNFGKKWARRLIVTWVKTKDALDPMILDSIFYWQFLSENCFKACFVFQWSWPQ